MRYDIVFKLSAPEELHDSFGPLEKISYITFDNYFKSRLFAILTKALGERIELIVIKMNTLQTHLPSTRKPSHTSSTFIIGLQLNPEECDKLVTKGPNNEDKDAGIKFRSFWGTKHL